MPEFTLVWTRLQYHTEYPLCRLKLLSPPALYRLLIFLLRIGKLILFLTFIKCHVSSSTFLLKRRTQPNFESEFSHNYNSTSSCNHDFKRQHYFFKGFVCNLLNASNVTMGSHLCKLTVLESQGSHHKGFKLTASITSTTEMFTQIPILLQRLPQYF